jgi:leader peptidase (prepilin peptidase)/N-methyltransferase
MDPIVIAKLYSYLSHPFTWVVFAFGAVFGSFYNVCILRIPEGTFWKNTRSVCPQCGAGIPAWYNIPILGWIILRGKTACCKKPLSIQYPIVELITAVGFVLLYWKFPFLLQIGDSLHVATPDLIRFIHASMFFSVLVICSFIDLRHMIIPDVFSIGLILTAPIWMFIHPELTWVSSAVGVLVGGGILYAIAWGYWLLRKQAGMGMGDVKLLAGMGGWLGYESIFPTVFYASVSGSIIGILVMIITKRSSMKFEIPFGPFLAMGALLFLFYGSSIIESILSRG